jgi:hypothetical protein
MEWFAVILSSRRIVQSPHHTAHDRHLNFPEGMPDGERLCVFWRVMLDSSFDALEHFGGRETPSDFQHRIPWEINPRLELVKANFSLEWKRGLAL